MALWVNYQVVWHCLLLWVATGCPGEAVTPELHCPVHPRCCWGQGPKWRGWAVCSRVHLRMVLEVRHLYLCHLERARGQVRQLRQRKESQNELVLLWGWILRWAALEQLLRDSMLAAAAVVLRCSWAKLTG